MTIDTAIKRTYNEQSRTVDELLCSTFGPTHFTIRVAVLIGRFTTVPEVMRRLLQLRKMRKLSRKGRHGRKVA